MTDDDLADANIDRTAAFVRGSDFGRAVAAIAEIFRDRIATASQRSLTATGREYLRERQELVAVRAVTASFRRG
jgi:hypothetical protein